jgi:hypothetical protein
MQFDWLIRAQSEWPIAMPVIFCVGFLLGYLVRAMVSWRRRRRARWAKEDWHGTKEAHHWRLQKPQAPSIAPAMGSHSLGGLADTLRDHVHKDVMSENRAGKGLH